jgi:hypothetical protein
MVINNNLSPSELGIIAKICHTKAYVIKKKLMCDGGLRSFLPLDSKFYINNPDIDEKRLMSLLPERVARFDRAMQDPSNFASILDEEGLDELEWMLTNIDPYASSVEIRPEVDNLLDAIDQARDLKRRCN